MPPTLLLIRHAQALHNVASDWSLHDPPLSELGESQCEELAKSLQESELGKKIMKDVELVVVSPMRRTLQTARLGLGGWLIGEEGRKVKTLIDPGWQENAEKPCDTGNSISVLETEFPDFDFSPLATDAHWPDKTHPPGQNPYAYTPRTLLARGQSCLERLYDRPEKVIAVVTHSGFLRVGICHRRFFNADWRVFEFDQEEMERRRVARQDRAFSVDSQTEQSRQDFEDDDFAPEKRRFCLREWPETEEMGGGMERSQKGNFESSERDFPPLPEKEAEVGEVTGESPVGAA